MINPDVQGELILSFLDERRRQLEQNSASADGKRRPNLSRRALASAGGALINLGAALQQRGQFDLDRPTPAPSLETN